MKAKKRRKVWVNEYPDGMLSIYANPSKRQALGAFCSDRVAVPFVESRPGDVVLSREEFDNLPSSMQRHIRLLRGGR